MPELPVREVAQDTGATPRRSPQFKNYTPRQFDMRPLRNVELGETQGVNEPADPQETFDNRAALGSQSLSPLPLLAPLSPISGSFGNLYSPTSPTERSVRGRKYLIPGNTANNRIQYHANLVLYICFGKRVSFQFRLTFIIEPDSVSSHPLGDGDGLIEHDSSPAQQPSVWVPPPLSSNNPFRTPISASRHKRGVPISNDSLPQSPSFIPKYTLRSSRSEAVLATPTKETFGEHPNQRFKVKSRKGKEPVDDSDLYPLESKAREIAKLSNERSYQAYYGLPPSPGTIRENISATHTGPVRNRFHNTNLEIAPEHQRSRTGSGATDLDYAAEGRYSEYVPGAKRHQSLEGTIEGEPDSRSSEHRSLMGKMAPPIPANEKLKEGPIGDLAYFLKNASPPSTMTGAKPVISSIPPTPSKKKNKTFGFFSLRGKKNLPPVEESPQRYCVSENFPVKDTYEMNFVSPRPPSHSNCAVQMSTSAGKPYLQIQIPYSEAAPQQPLTVPIGHNRHMSIVFQDNKRGGEQDVITSSEMERALVGGSTARANLEGSARFDMQQLIEVLEKEVGEVGGRSAEGIEMEILRARLREVEHLNGELVNALKEMLGLGEGGAKEVLEHYAMLKGMKGE